jgi:hypothetical protein
MKDLRNILLLALVAVALVILTGCAQMGTNQTDQRTTTHEYHLDARGRTNRIVATVNQSATTKAKATALISSSSTFEGLDASQNGRDQGLKVDKSGQSANVDKILDLFGGMARMGAAMYGIPTGGAAAAPPAIQTPPGMKWILVPIDDPSSPRWETQPPAPVP